MSPPCHRASRSGLRIDSHDASRIFALALPATLCLDCSLFSLPFAQPTESVSRSRNLCIADCPQRSRGHCTQSLRYSVAHWLGRTCISTRLHVTFVREVSQIFRTVISSRARRSTRWRKRPDPMSAVTGNGALFARRGRRWADHMLLVRSSQWRVVAAGARPPKKTASSSSAAGDRGDVDADIVASDDALRLDRHGHDPHRRPSHDVDCGDDERQAGLFEPRPRSPTGRGRRPRTACRCEATSRARSSPAIPMRRPRLPERPLRNPMFGAALNSAAGVRSGIAGMSSPCRRTERYTR